MDLDKIIEDLMEKRFKDKINEIIGNKFEPGHYFDVSEFDKLITRFIEKKMELYINSKEKKIMKLVNDKLDKEINKLQFSNFSICLKMPDVEDKK